MKPEPIAVQVCFQNETLAQEFYEWLVDKANLYLFADSLYRRDFPDLQFSWDDKMRVINAQVIPNDEVLS